MERAGRGCPGGFGVPVPGGVQWLDTGLGDEVGIRHRLELMILEGFSSLAIPGSHEAPNIKSQCPTPKLPGTHSFEDPARAQTPGLFIKLSEHSLLSVSAGAAHKSHRSFHIILTLHFHNGIKLWQAGDLYHFSRDLWVQHQPFACVPGISKTLLRSSYICFTARTAFGIKQVKNPGELQRAALSKGPCVCLRGSSEDDHLCKEVLQLLKKFSTARGKKDCKQSFTLPKVVLNLSR